MPADLTTLSCKAFNAWEAHGPVIALLRTGLVFSVGMFQFRCPTENDYANRLIHLQTNSEKHPFPLR